MTGHQAACLQAITQQQESHFFFGMIRIVYQAGVLVQKNSLSFLERDTVFRDVGSGLSWVPGKGNIAHSIILAVLLPLPLASAERPVSLHSCGQG